MDSLPLTGEVLPAVELSLPLKCLRLDWRIEIIEGIHQPLYVRLVHFLKINKFSIIFKNIKLKGSEVMVREVWTNRDGDKSST